MNFPLTKKKIVINNKEISFEIGRLAFQANAAVLAQQGDTVVLATVTSSSPKEELDYFPLYVEYKEKLYAGGKIKGSRWVKREGRPSDEAVLTARLIDRSIRPLFPKDYKNEVQVVVTVLSVDSENEPDILAINAISAALSISDIPWQGPIAAARMKEPDFPDLDLVVSNTKKAIIMVEAGANEIKEEEMFKALKGAFIFNQKMVNFISDLTKEIGHKKQSFTFKKIKADLLKTIKEKIQAQISELVAAKISVPEKLDNLAEIKMALKEKLEDEPKKEINMIVDDLFKKEVRNLLLKKKIRVDGRKIDEIRQLKAEVGILPRTHGSAIFQRGLTQALTITTLGSPSLEQLIENMKGEETKRYIHHYYMPPYSVGETGRMGWPSRREVGHGALAERALEPMIPSEDDFPYTIRVVSQITSSNGSTSMASVCGSSLSLMDAGVPLKKPVAGIAMGLVAQAEKEEIKEYIILTDIMGLEDHLGDMDFKVAGTEDGITALQMDVKIIGITPKILVEGLIRAKKIRLYILSVMNKAIAKPRLSISAYAPQVVQVKISKEKIGEVIGPGGKMIRRIIKETEANVNVDDDGLVTISGMNREGINKAAQWVKDLTREVVAGEEFVGEVKRIQPFGAFVEILPGKDGLVHVSQMSENYVKNPEEVVKIGQKVKVKVREIDEMGRINLTMLLNGQKQKPFVKKPFSPSRHFSSPRFKKRF